MNDSAPWVVVGLGNPGDRYSGHRHNVGAMVAGELSRRYASPMRAHKARVSAAQLRLGTLAGRPGPAAVIAVPHTYMNESGGPVKALLSFFGADPDRLIVIHDELDIQAGLVRLKLGGGEGGHNGVRAVSRALDTRDYLRVRVGIGRPPGRMEPADFVLRDFSKEERTDLPFLLGDAADAVELLAQEGLLVAQQRFHSPR